MEVFTNMFMKNAKVSTLSQRYTGFTLAEVLITLGVIGIVAAITIPILLNRSEEASLAAALKEDISLFSQATMQMANDNGGEIPYRDDTFVFFG